MQEERPTAFPGQTFVPGGLPIRGRPTSNLLRYSNPIDFAVGRLYFDLNQVQARIVLAHAAICIFQLLTDQVVAPLNISRHFKILRCRNDGMKSNRANTSTLA